MRWNPHTLSLTQQQHTHSSSLYSIHAHTAAKAQAQGRVYTALLWAGPNRLPLKYTHAIVIVIVIVDTTVIQQIIVFCVIVVRLGCSNSERRGCIIYNANLTGQPVKKSNRLKASFHSKKKP